MVKLTIRKVLSSSIALKIKNIVAITLRHNPIKWVLTFHFSSKGE